MNNETLLTCINDYKARVEKTLDLWLPDPRLPPTRLHNAMRYACLGNGKRLRPVLVYATGSALGIAHKRLDAIAGAIEVIHAYSLVHDDLPAMDDDDLRRGRPTCHRAFDEATTILVGDALQTLAIQILATDTALETTPEVRLQMIAWLSQATGSRGLVGGQAMDLDAEGKDITWVELENIHIYKTGALIRACVRLAVLLGGFDGSEQSRALDRYAKCVGLAFQVQDDILDVAGQTAALGKTQGKDRRQYKATYPAILGLEAAREKAQLLYQDAIAALENFDTNADQLRFIAHYIINRDH